MDVVYVDTNHKNELIYTLTHMEVENNKMLFNSRDWAIIAPFISNSAAINMFAPCTLMERHVYIELHLFNII